MDPAIWTKQEWEERLLEFDATDSLAAGDSVASIDEITAWEGTTEKTSSISKIVLATAGTGYAVDEIISVTQAGASGGTIHVTAIGAGGTITAYHIEAGGSGYVTANGLATVGGNNDATFNIVTMIRGATSLVGNKAYAPFAGGLTGHSYHLRVRLNTANGDKVEDDLKILVRNIGG